MFTNGRQSVARHSSTVYCSNPTRHFGFGQQPQHWTEGDYADHIEQWKKLTILDTEWHPNALVQSSGKKIEDILALGPTTKTKARSFIDAINFYRSLWSQRAHVLTLLANLTGNKDFSWDKEKQRAFDNEMKATITSQCYNQYVDLNLPIEFIPTHLTNSLVLLLFKTVK